MKSILGGIAILGLVACSSSSKGGSGGGGAGGMNGGGGATSTCGTAQPSLLYTSPATVIVGPAVDDQFIYFVENISDINKISKAGGSPTTLASDSAGFLDPTTRLYVDGSALYYSDNATLYSLTTAGGTPKALATSASTTATGIDPLLAFDSQFIYFGDKVSGSAGQAMGTVNKIPKAGGTATVLASNQAGPGAIALDDSNVYWVNGGTNDAQLNALNNTGIGAVAKSGGSASALFTAKSDGSGVTPTIADLLPTSSSLYFSSVTLNDVSYIGEYRIAKTGGTPALFSDCPTLGAFIQNGVMYANCGDRIAKFDLTTGNETDLVCFPTPLEGAVAMTNDATKIYYVKIEHASGASDNPYAIYSIPLQ